LLLLYNFIILFILFYNYITLLSITENISTFIRVANGHIDHAILLFKINPGKQLFIYKLLIDNSDRIG